MNKQIRYKVINKRICRMLIDLRAPYMKLRQERAVSFWTKVMRCEFQDAFSSCWKYQLPSSCSQIFLSCTNCTAKWWRWMLEDPSYLSRASLALYRLDIHIATIKCVNAESNLAFHLTRHKAGSLSCGEAPPTSAVLPSHPSSCLYSSSVYNAK